MASVGSMQATTVATEEVNFNIVLSEYTAMPFLKSLETIYVCLTRFLCSEAYRGLAVIILLALCLLLRVFGLCLHSVI